MDIDIDFRDDFAPEEIFPECIPAIQVNNGVLRKHNAGVYFQNIPVDAITGYSAIPFKEAEDLEYFKVDMLHLPSVLNYFDSKKDIRRLMRIEPDWTLLEERSVVEKLFQIGNHFDLISDIKPKNVVELADCIALIRPSKYSLAKKYKRNKEKVRKVLYMVPSDGGYHFKRSHSLAYAYNIILQLHLIKGGIL